MRDLIATDLDGVLAASPPESLRPWRFMDGAARESRRAELERWYACADVWFRPACDFIVVTARKNTPAIRVITEEWLRRNFGEQFQGVHMLDAGRTLTNVIDFKASVLRSVPHIPMYIDDTLPLLRGLQKAAVPQQLWRYRAGSITPLA